MQTKIFFAILFSASFSCSFPSPKFLSRVNEIEKNNFLIKDAIFRELPKSKNSLPIEYINDRRLRNFLSRLKVKEISITYNSPLLYDFYSEPIYLTSYLDSVITIMWNKRVGKQIEISSFYYFFGRIKPKVSRETSPTRKMAKLNDSIWIQKDIAEIITIH